jgi:hypothetical protein
MTNGMALKEGGVGADRETGITSVLSAGWERGQVRKTMGRGRLGGSVLGSGSISICGSIDRDIESCNVLSSKGFDLRNKFRNDARFGVGLRTRLRLRLRLRCGLRFRRRRGSRYRSGYTDRHDAGYEERYGERHSARSERKSQIPSTKSQILNSNLRNLRLTQAVVRTP